MIRVRDDSLDVKIKFMINDIDDHSSHASPLYLKLWQCDFDRPFASFLDSFEENFCAQFRFQSVQSIFLKRQNRNHAEDEEEEWKGDSLG